MNEADGRRPPDRDGRTNPPGRQEQLANQVNDRRPLLVGGERLALDVGPISSGGGDKYHPTTPEQAAMVLSPMVSRLSAELKALPAEAVGTAIYFQTTLLPNYLAASHFPSHLLGAAGLVAVGSRAAQGTYKTEKISETTITKSLIVAGHADSLETLAVLIDGAGTGGRSQRNAFQQLREISDVRMAAQSEILGDTPREAETWEAVLNPQGIDQAGDFVPTDDETFEKWIAWIANLGGQVVSDYRRNEAGLTFVPVRLDATRAVTASHFNPLRSMRPMPVLRPVPTGFLRSSTPVVLPPADTTPEGTHTVAVFDGGIQAEALLDHVAVADLTSEPDDDHATSHGTAVTGAVTYGLIHPGHTVARPASRVDHYRVLPSPPDDRDIHSYKVLDRIEQVLTNTHYPIVNLSLGPDICVEDTSEPNRWTSTLDRIGYEHDILFVVAAGNNGAEDESTGLNLVQSPADMANCVSVGACNHAHNESWDRTWYSAIGPGRSGSRIQPNGVQFGGDVAAGLAFHGLHANRQLWETQGTSFACALTTNALSRLATLLGSEWKSPNALRTFATHFAKRHPDGDVRAETGNGRFLLDYESVLECEPNEVHLLYQGTLDRYDLLSLALPVTPTIVSGNVSLRMTMAFASPVEPTQPLEYTQATIEPVFRPHADRFRFAKDSKNKIVNVRSDTDEATKLMTNGYAMSGHPVSKPLPGTLGSEVHLREGGKWETVRRFDLSMRAASLLEPRLDLSYVARKSGLLQASATSLDFTLLVSVRAPRIDTLYTDVEASFPVLNRLDVVNVASVGSELNHPGFRRG